MAIFRRKIALAALVSLTLGGCQKDETVAGYGAAGKTWYLVELDKTAVSYSATLIFEDGTIRGDGPCNAYGADMVTPYPWFRAEKLFSTERACPDLAAEADYFDALSSMTLSEISGNILLLSDESGREMVFSSRP